MKKAPSPLRDRAEMVALFLAAFALWPWHFGRRAWTRPRVNRQQRAKLVIASARLEGSQWIGSLVKPKGDERVLDLSALGAAKWFVLTRTNSGFDNPEEYDLLELDLRSGEPIVLEADEGGPLRELVVELQSRGLVGKKPRELQLNFWDLADFLLILAWSLLLLFASLWWRHRTP